MLYKTEHNETQQKQKMSQSPSKKRPFKKHEVQTAQQLVWFQEKQVANKNLHRRKHSFFLFDNLAPLGRFWVPFWRPLDFEGVSTSIIFEQNQIIYQKMAARSGVRKKT